MIAREPHVLGIPAAQADKESRLTEPGPSHPATSQRQPSKTNTAKKALENQNGHVLGHRPAERKPARPEQPNGQRFSR